MVLAASRVFAVWAGHPGPRALWAAGGLWLALTLAFEFGSGIAAGRPVEEMLADYALWRGRLWPLLLLATLVGPRLLGGRRSA